MSDSNLPSYIVDTRGEGTEMEFLVYKLDTDSWGKPYYKPSSLPPLSCAEALQIARGIRRGMVDG